MKNMKLPISIAPWGKILVRAFITGSFGLVLVNDAEPQQQTTPVKSYPLYPTLRYGNDYAYLKNPALRTNALDSLKYIPTPFWGLNEAYLTLGGQLRDRYEYFNNYLFGSGPQTHSGYNLLRVMADA